MWLSAQERHIHRQPLCKRLLHNYNPSEVCNIRVVLMVWILHHIPDAKERKADAGAASLICNATRHENTEHGIISAARELCNATSRV
jgi:hypothetical protein